MANEQKLYSSFDAYGIDTGTTVAGITSAIKQLNAKQQAGEIHPTTANLLLQELDYLTTMRSIVEVAQAQADGLAKALKEIGIE